MQIDSEPIRLAIYLSLAALASAGMSTIWLVRNQPVTWRKFPHVGLALSFLALLILFLLLLAVSIRDLHWLKRGDLVWPIVATSGGASLLGWTWWIKTVRVTFRIEWPQQWRNENGGTAR